MAYLARLLATVGSNFGGDAGTADSYEFASVNWGEQRITGRGKPRLEEISSPGVDRVSYLNLGRPGALLQFSSVAGAADVAAAEDLADSYEEAAGGTAILERKIGTGTTQRLLVFIVSVMPQPKAGELTGYGEVSGGTGVCTATWAVRVLENLEAA